MRLKYIIFLAVVLLFAASINSCSKTSTGNTTPPVPAISFQIKNDSHFGSIIVDSNGNTLYFFSFDANGSSACTGNCLTTWPVAYVANPTLGTGLNDLDFSFIARPDGSKQTTYK